jgi:predicted nuclease of predicted toxin-antitoxin system
MFPESKQVRELGLENATDTEIWNYGKDNGFTIVTFDSDFFDLSTVWGSPPKIIWIHSGNLTTKQIGVVLKKHNKAILEFNEDKELDCLKIIDGPI